MRINFQHKLCMAWEKAVQSKRKRSIDIRRYRLHSAIMNIRWKRETSSTRCINSYVSKNATNYSHARSIRWKQVQNESEIERNRTDYVRCNMIALTYVESISSRSKIESRLHRIDFPKSNLPFLIKSPPASIGGFVRKSRIYAEHEKKPFP